MANEIIAASIDDLKKELWLRQRERMVWTTKDGTEIPIKMMTEQHMLNAINQHYRILDELSHIEDSEEVYRHSQGN